MANLLLNMMGAFAEFERELIRERQHEGIALAKERGVYRGHTRSLTEVQVTEVQVTELRERAGVSKTMLAKECGVSRKTVYASLRAGASPTEG